MEFISDVFGTENLMSENASMFDCFEQYDIYHLKEKAQTILLINGYGYSRLNFCKSNDLLILNGTITLTIFVLFGWFPVYR